MNGARAGANKIQARLLHGGNHRFVFRHKTIASKYRVIVVISCDINDLLDALRRSSLLAPL